MNRLLCVSEAKKGCVEPIDILKRYRKFLGLFFIRHELEFTLNNYKMYNELPNLS